MIDDDAGIRDALAEFLEEGGHLLACAASVREALSYLDTRLRLRQSAPRAILLDLYLAGESGATFLDALGGRPELATVPVYVMTAAAVGHGDAGDAAKHPRVHGVVQKPFQADELLRLLAPYLPART